MRAVAPRSVIRPALADVLVGQGMVAKSTVDQTLNRLGGVSADLGATLLVEGALSEEQLARALAIQFGLPFDPLLDFRVEPSFYERMSVKLMQRHPFVPIVEAQGRLKVAVPDPQDLLGLDELELLLGRELELVVSPKSAILTALERSEGSSQALRELEAEYRSVLVKEDERGEEILTLDHVQLDLLAAARTQREMVFATPRNIFALPSSATVNASRPVNVPDDGAHQDVIATELAQFHYLGFVRAGDEWQKKQDMAVLTKNDDLHVVKAGEVIEKHVVVKTITQESVILFDRDSRLEYTVLLSEEPQTPTP